MKMQMAAVAAVLAGIAVAGFVYWSTAFVGNVQHFLKNRSSGKTESEDAPPSEE
ncbi:MAG: hypothetical protein RBU21_14325 [FCB group bacterium]|jgi:uncharacterized protein YxeA|nr:hypothetical protein [FCB group bacterium]